MILPSALNSAVLTGGGSGGAETLTTTDLLNIKAILRPNLTVINQGVQKASILVPHTTNLS